MVVAKKVLGIAIVVAVYLVSTTAPVAFGQEVTESRLVLNSTGTGESLFVIGRSGVGDSRLVLNTVVIEVGLSGVHVYPIECHFGLLRAGDIRATDCVFTVHNAGYVSLNVTIGVSGDWEGATGSWTHSDECSQEQNTAGLRAVVEDGNDHTSIIVRKTEPYNYLVTNLAPDEVARFGLELYLPDSIDDYSEKSNGIFITVSEA